MVTAIAMRMNAAVRWDAAFFGASVGSSTRRSILVAEAENPVAPGRLQFGGGHAGDRLHRRRSRGIRLRGRLELLEERDQQLSLLEEKAEVAGGRVVDPAVVLAVELFGRRLHEVGQRDALVDRSEERR